MRHVIRSARADDRRAVEAIVESAYSKYIPRLGRKPKPMLDDYAALIGEGRVHVIEDAGVVRGVLVLIPEAETLLLDNIAISPDAQRKGLGRALLAFAEQTARAAGYDAIRLYTNVLMSENIALYARTGYIETHRTEEHGLHRVFMSKRLA